MPENKSISIVIPSYNRGRVLLDTINMLVAQDRAANEIIIVDQSEYPPDDLVPAQLQKWHSEGVINWLRLSKPSIPTAMNRGLQIARSDYVLFLDDDVEFDDAFIQKHMALIGKHQWVAYVGQIIQPWEEAEQVQNYTSGNGLSRDLAFPFYRDEPAQIANCMAGHLCVRRLDAIAAGGFDENFVGAAYRFETEFCRRLIRHTGQRFRFEPGASLFHLHHNSGGTRSDGDYLRSASPGHSMGDYYFALLESRGQERWNYIVKRLFGSLMVKFYLSHPWYLPIRLLAETRGLIAASCVRRTGPRLIGGNHEHPQTD